MFNKVLLLLYFLSTTCFANSNWNLHENVKVMTPEGQIRAGELSEGHVVSVKDKAGEYTAEIIHVNQERINALPVVSFKLIDFDTLNVEGHWIKESILITPKKTKLIRSVGTYRAGKILKVLLPTVLIASMAQGVDSGLASCPPSTSLCPGLCAMLMANGCSPWGQAWIAYMSAGIVSPILATLCTAGAPATASTCNTACIAAACSPFTP